MTDCICDESMTGHDEVTVSGALHQPQAPQRSTLHDENVAMDLPCCSDCDFAGCENRLQSHLAQVEETLMLHGEIGLFATEDIKGGTWVASFGRVRRVKPGGQPVLGYSIAVRATGTGGVVYVTPCARMGLLNTAHAINHTCSETHVNVEFIHTGDVGGSLLVLARTTRDVGAKQELFVCYGPRESIGFFDNHPCLCHQCGSLP